MGAYIGVPEAGIHDALQELVCGGVTGRTYQYARLACSLTPASTWPCQDCRQPESLASKSHIHVQG